MAARFAATAAAGRWSGFLPGYRTSGASSPATNAKPRTTWALSTLAASRFCFAAIYETASRLLPRTMKTIVHLILLCLLAATAWADQLARSTPFKSTESFIAAVKAFKPADSDSDLKKLFTIVEEKNVYPPATADAVDSCEIVWEDNTQAIVFATAQPPTNNTLWKIGVLFYLTRDSGNWRISDVHRFDAQNKAAQVTCNLTSGEQTEPIVTIRPYGV